MRISEFEWDEENLLHAIRHGVSREEIEEVIARAFVIRRGRSGVSLAYGQTFDGRYVIAIFEYKGGGFVRPFGARPMTMNERKRFRRWHD
jgi:uncharacterized DUF497 family protein